MRLLLALAVPAVTLTACSSAKVSMTDTADAIGADSAIDTADTADTSASNVQLVIDPGALDFGTLLPGESASLAFTVQNTGDSGATLTLSTETGTAFSLDTERTTIGAGDTTTVNVTFTEVTGGAFTDAAVIFDFDGLEAGRVQLTGAIDSNVDTDGDGVLSADDCDDTNPDAYPGASDAWYDGVDSDCAGNDDYDQDADGHADAAYGGDDCNDLDATINPDATETWYDGVDQDCVGDNDFDQDHDGYLAFGADVVDCDDTDATVYPSAPDAWYDGVDSDCAGNDDYDQDGDGHASDAYGGDDCLDTDATVYSGAPEVWYDGIDSDCAGDNDYDADGDGYLSSAWGGDDCDDTRATVYPGAVDGWYDGIDADCAGNDDYDQDGDGDRATAFGGTDCDDTNAAFYGGAPDTWYDGVDNDCVGNDDYDQDGDGQQASAYGGTDCNDTDATIYLGAPDTWYDGIDSDCAGNNDYDADADGDLPTVWGGGDCDDADATRASTLPEVCDGVDNDCDGTRDDGLTIGTTAYYVDADADTWGVGTAIYTCAMPPGYAARILDCDDANADVSPGSAEVAYNHVDDNCNSYVDDMVAETESSWTVRGNAADDALGEGALALTDDVAFDGNPELVACSPTLDGLSQLDPGACGFLDVDTAADPVVWSGGVFEMYGGNSDGNIAANQGMGTGFAVLGNEDEDRFPGASTGSVELVFGAAGFDREGSNRGGVFIVSAEYYRYYRSSYATGRSYPSGMIYGSAASDALGTSLSVGDMNGDGAPDIAAGAPGVESEKGRTYVFLGDSAYEDYLERDGRDLEYRSGTAGSLASYSVTGVTAGDRLGTVTLLLDVDNDGYDDLLTCAPDDDDNGTSSGSCWLDRGRASVSASAGTVVDSVADGYVLGASANDRLGATRFSLAGGDFSGDGADDIAIGAPGYDGGTTNGGAIGVWTSGSFVGGAESFTGADWFVTGDGALGTAVSLGGDLDGDGTGDLLGGAPSAGSAGRVYGLFGGIASGTYDVPSGQDASWVGAAAGDLFGTSVTTTRDLTGDGRDEFAAGAPGNDGTAGNAGKVYVLPVYP